jgi:hypothetical protein
VPDSTRAFIPPANAGTTDVMCARCATCPASVATQADGVVCEPCAALYYTSCHGCAQRYRSHLTCVDCGGCDRCGATVRDADTVDTVDGDTICRPCRNACYWQCATCRGWNRDGDDCGNGCCDPYDCDCEDCRDRTRFGLIYEWDYKPDPIFHGAGPLFLGPELELETPYERTEECAAVAQSYLRDLGYLKEDGSLINGFEIVAHPMSYPWALRHFPWQLLPELRRRGCRVTDNTGLHVHVSRAAFTSTCHTYRWMKFIYRNQRQVETLARRSSSEWAAFTSDDRRAVKDYAKGGYGARYRAINAGNPDTFELRVFASSLDPTEVQAALGFTAASVEYTRTLTPAAIVGKGGWSWPAFVAWLAERPTYTPLRQQLQDLACVC